MRRIATIGWLTIGLGLTAPAYADGAGGPIQPVQGNTGIAVPGGTYRYVALDGRPGTVVGKIRVADGRQVAFRRFAGTFGIPGVDFNGTLTGLAADGRTLVLADMPVNPAPRTTSLLVLDARRLTVRERITLPGYSTVDAISPNGRWLYLIHYPAASRGDTNRYDVRAYDLPARRLIAKPVVDPRDHGEAMAGFAITRAIGAGGRWAYTLYTRPSGAPFVHALDTAGVRAVCVDLPSLARADLGNARLALSPGGGDLQIVSDVAPLATIDTRTFAVTPGVTGAAPPLSAGSQAPTRRAAGGDDFPWWLMALAVGALAAVAVTGLRRRGRLVT
jgi:hypothetical protein